MTILSTLIATTSLLASHPDCPAPAAAAAQATQTAQIDCTWLTVDSASKTATFLLTSALTQLNGGLNFNGFNEGKLVLNVPVNWNVVIKFTNKDANLTQLGRSRRFREADAGRSDGSCVSACRVGAADGGARGRGVGLAAVRREQAGDVSDFLRRAGPWARGHVVAAQGLGNRQATDPDRDYELR